MSKELPIPKAAEGSNGVSLSDGVLKTQLGVWKLESVTSVRLTKGIVWSRAFVCIAIAAIFATIATFKFVTPQITLSRLITIFAVHCFMGFASTLMLPKLRFRFVAVIMATAKGEHTVWQEFAVFSMQAAEKTAWTVMDTVATAILPNERNNASPEF